MSRCCCWEVEPAQDRARLLPPASPLVASKEMERTTVAGTPVVFQHCNKVGSARRKALLIGINYFGTSGELHGCINDVHKMRSFLIENGFGAPDCLRVLTDDTRQPGQQPTRANITAAMQWLRDGARPGDVLFFHFSGHGGQVVDVHGDEEDGMDETICPVDFEHAGQICDDDLFEQLIAPLPQGCRLTALLDCCHSGHGMDFPYTLHPEGVSPAWACDPLPRFAAADVILFSVRPFLSFLTLRTVGNVGQARRFVTNPQESGRVTYSRPSISQGCEDDQCSADAACRYGMPAGAMTTAFLECFAKGHTYTSLITALDETLSARGFDQRPQISSTLPFELSRQVSIDDILPQGSPSAPIIRVPKQPNPRREFGGGFGDMLHGESTGFMGVAAASLAVQAVQSGALKSMFGGIFGVGSEKHTMHTPCQHAMVAHETSPAPPSANKTGETHTDDDCESACEESEEYEEEEDDNSGDDYEDDYEY